MLNLCLVKLAFAQGIIHSVSSTYTFIFPELRFLVSQKHQIHGKNGDARQGDIQCLSPAMVLQTIRLVQPKLHDPQL